MKTLVVNLYGGPGTGKSSTMAGVFAALKNEGVNCEMTPEFAKEKVWEESLKVLDDQLYIFAKQNHKIRRLIGQVDVVITDSPLLFSLIYGNEEPFEFREVVKKTYEKYWNLNFFLKRVKPYNPKGRVQTEEKAKTLDELIKAMLESVTKNDFYEYESSPESVPVIVKEIMIARMLKK